MPQTSPADAKDRKISVLLVEPDPQVAQLLLLLLAPEAPPFRFEPVCVEDVDAGLRSLARGSRIDAVLLGLTLGGAGGLEGVRTLRREAPHAPIVALVAPGAEARGREAVKLGAKGFQVRGRLNSDALKRALSRCCS
jgi:DNA-binding NarL/FixJ family response regulator